MNKLSLVVLAILIVPCVSNAQRASGNEGKPGWTADNEQQYRHNDALYMQKLQKKAKQERQQGHPGGPMNQQLRSEQQNRSASQYLKDLVDINKRSGQ